MKTSNVWLKRFEKGYMVKGKKEGPKSIIFAGVHGNEICGVKAFYDVVPKLKIEHGTVVFVFANPSAIKKNVRQTGMNLNRAFRDSKFYTKKQKETYEYKRAQFLKKWLAKADVLLDIHSTRNPGKPFIISSEKAQPLTSVFSKKFVREVWGFGDIEPGATDDYTDSLGKIGITIECGQHQDTQSVTVAKETIETFLRVRGHIQTRKILKKNMRPTFKVEKLHITKSKSFTLKREFADFSAIKKGIIIGKDGTEVIKSDRNGVILFAHTCQGTGQEAFILGKKVS